MPAKYAVYGLSQLQLPALKPGSIVDHAADVTRPDLNRPAQDDLSALNELGQ